MAGRSAAGQLTLLSAILLLLGLIPTLAAARETVYIQGIGIDGAKRELDVSRYPALYTGDFDDCLGGQSLFNITRFDAAYYSDNATVLFHLDGTTNLQKESLILHMSVVAYGENRYNLTYDPCKANIHSLCPLRAAVPVQAFVVIPIAPRDVAGIPSIALGIPDFEGYARIQIFANSTQTEIGCFQAVMTNGSSLSQPKYIGSILGIFAAVAAVASFLTAAYGLRISAMRMHYAHSFSVAVIFETFQSMFLTGALAINWPSVLPAWWSNFSWTTGMFANDRMVRQISKFTGNNGNISQVGGAGPVVINNDGGLTQQIYGRALANVPTFGISPTGLARRAAYNASDPYDYTWGGSPRTPGMPMPGTWPGFGGTLSKVNIPPAEAFTIGLIWLLVVIAIVALFVVAAKLLLDLFAKIGWVKTDGFDFFRSHVGGYMASALLRTLFIAYFSTMTLSIFQLSLQGPAGPTAVAALVWVIFFLGMGAIATYACYIRLRHGKFEVVSDTIKIQRRRVLKKIPLVVATRASNEAEEETAEKPRRYASVPFFRITYADKDPNGVSVHEDEAYVKRFGWLSARYRRRRWWYFAFYLGYQLVRACFLGGGSRTPTAQVIGLFVFEVLALAAIIKLQPFEGSRNSVVAVWLLSVSKIVTTGLSIALLPKFNLGRIVATVIGFVIIVVQGFLAVAVLVLIVLGVISTWMSLSRNREEFTENLDQTRIAYFEHVEARAADLPKPKKESSAPPEPVQPSFNVSRVQRLSKIEDENGDQITDLGRTFDAPTDGATPIRRSRANSASSRMSVSSLPRGARVHRASWSSRDFAQWDAEMGRAELQRTGHQRTGSQKMPAGALVRRPMTPTREAAEDMLLTIDTDHFARGAIYDSGGSNQESPMSAATGSTIDRMVGGKNRVPVGDDAAESARTPSYNKKDEL